MKNDIRRRLVSLAATGALVAAGLLTLAGSANAVDSTTCLGSSTITYSPGLTFTPRTVFYAETDSFGSCVSTDPTLTSGTSFSGISIDGASCLGLPSVHEDPGFTITWNNGGHSVVDLTFTDTIVAASNRSPAPARSSAGYSRAATRPSSGFTPSPARCNVLPVRE